MLKRGCPCADRFFHEVGRISTQKAQVSDAKVSKGSSYGNDGTLVFINSYLESYYIREVNLGMTCQDSNLEGLHRVAEL